MIPSWRPIRYGGVRAKPQKCATLAEPASRELIPTFGEDSVLAPVPQKNAFIIDEDREFALMVAAALRTDGLKVAISQGDRDPIEEIRAERPDVVLMRAEGREGASGYALCNRLKSNKRLQSMPIFLYSAAADDAVFDDHKKKDTRADEYILLPEKPPYPLEDFRDRVKGVLFPPAGQEKPPPLPPVAKEPVRAMTEEDTLFIEEVRESLANPEPEEPVSVPPLRREASIAGRRTTADTKLEMLRQRLREREGALARMTDLLKTKERESHDWSERLVEKDVEIQSLKMTIEEISSTSESRRVELDRRTAEFNASFEQLLEEKITRENELIHNVALKEKELADARNAHKNAEEREKTLKEALAQAENDAKVDAEKNRTKLSELGQVIGERERTLREREADLEGLRGEKARLEKDRADHLAKIGQQEQQRLELEGLILGLRNDLAGTREEIDNLIKEQRFELEAQKEVIDGLRGDLASTEATLAETERDLSEQLDETRTNLALRVDELADARARGDSLDAELEALKASSAETEAELRADLARTTGELDSERVARAESERSLNAELLAAHALNDDLSAQSASEAQRHAEQEAEFRAQLADRDGRISNLEQTLEDERGRATDTESELRAEINRLEGARLSAEQALEDREAELQGIIEAKSHTILEREQELDRLEATLASTRKELGAANDQIASLEASLAEEQGRFQDLERRGRDQEAALRAQLADGERELERTKEEGAQLESDLREQIIRLGTDLAVRGDEIDDLQKRLENETRDRVQAERTVAQLERALEGTRQDLESTTKALRQTEKDLGSTRETLALREGRLSEREEALKLSLEKRAELEHALAALRSEHDARGAENGRLQGRIAALDEQVQSLRVESAELEDNLEHIRTELERRQAELAASRAEANERATRLEDAARTLTSRDTELTRVREELADLHESHETLLVERDNLASDKRSREAELERVQATNTKLAAELDAVGDRADELEAEVDVRGGRIDLLEKTLAATQAERAQLEQVRVGLNADLARAQEAFVRLENELSRSQKEWASGREELTKDRDSARNRLKELGAELDKVRGERESLKQAYARLEEQNAARVHAYEKQLAEQRNEITTLNQRYTDSETRLENVEINRAELESQHGEAIRRIEALTAESTSERVRNERELTRLREEAAALATRLDESTARAATLASEKGALDERRKTELFGKDAQIAELRQKLEERAGEIAAEKRAQAELKEKLDQARREKDEVENRYVRELEELHDDYQTKAREVEQKHAVEVEDLRKQKIEATRQLRTSQLAAQRLTDRMRKMESERPAKSELEADFESFIAHIGDGTNPSATPGASGRPLPRPLPVKDGTQPPIAAGKTMVGALTPPPPAPRKTGDLPPADVTIPNLTPVEAPRWTPPEGSKAPPLPPKPASGPQPPAKATTSPTGKKPDVAAALGKAAALGAEDDEDDITQVNNLPESAPPAKVVPPPPAPPPPPPAKGKSPLLGGEEDVLALFDRQFDSIKED